MDYTAKGNLLKSDPYLDRVLIGCMTAAIPILGESDNVANAVLRKKWANEVLSSEASAKRVAQRVRFNMMTAAIVTNAADEAAITDANISTMITNGLGNARLIEAWTQG